MRKKVGEKMKCEKLINSNLRQVMSILNENGYEAYLVGGAVRSFLMGKEIQDYDITTNASADQIEKIFEKSIPTGKEFGTITVLFNSEEYEITTYRVDGNYSDGRHPDNVIFTRDLKEDLSRRDFTINAMCCDKEGELIDYFKGYEDLENKVIRAIGEPDKRFNEDALRMLRAVRFMCQLDFSIEDSTYSSIKENYKLTEKVSVERINQEFTKILLSPVPSKGVRTLIDTGLMDYIVPEYYETVGFEQHNPHHDKDVFDHSMEVLDNIEPVLNLRLAAFFHDICKPKCFTRSEDGRGHFYGHHIESAKLTQDIMKRLRYSNDLIEDVCTLIRYHYLKEIEIGEKAVKRFINNVGAERLEDLFKLNIADLSGKPKKVGDKNGYEKVETLRRKSREILDRKEPLSVKDLAVNGKDLIELGLKPGKEIGDLLDQLLEIVLDKPEENTKERLLSIIKEIKNK